MLRAVIAFILIAGAVGGVFGYRWYQQDRALQDRQQAQISDLAQQVLKLQQENEELKDRVTKIQQENDRLAAANEAFHKAVEQSKLTGKPAEEPRMAFPPK